MNQIAGMWICDNCNTLATVSVATDTIVIEQCECVTNERKTNE
jgi:hypothetical protein